jgi:hypothetical protein
MAAVATFFLEVHESRCLKCSTNSCSSYARRHAPRQQCFQIQLTELMEEVTEESRTDENRRWDDKGKLSNPS